MTPMMVRARAVLPAAVLLLAAGLAHAPLSAQDLPAPTGPVNDFAGILAEADERALLTEIEALERETTAEVAVVTVPSLGGRAVEEYATALFNQWGIGQADRDNGVLVLVAVNEREMRIEVGYGLEGVLPDGLAGAVIRETFLPAFRDGDYPRGIRQGVARVVEIVRRNERLTPEQIAAIERANAEAGTSWLIAAFMSIFVGVGAMMMGTAAGARVVVQMFAGAMFLGMALLMAAVGAPRNALAVLALFAVAVAVVGYRLGQRPKWRRSLRGSSSSGSQGWVAGGSGGSSSGSSGSSGSDSFGGGSSGGGGASGRW